MSRTGDNISLGEAARVFLDNLSPKERERSQHEVNKFVRWYGWERPFAALTAPEVGNYARGLSVAEPDYMKKHGIVRSFLGYAKKEGWTNTNLAGHLRAKKGKTRFQPSAGRDSPEATSLTQQGHAELKAELAALKNKLPQAIDEVRKAAADKDFRENAPLEAAREQRGHLEGRIKELEAILKSATVIDEKQEATLKVCVGDSIVLIDLASGEELHYVIVSPREADPTRGKISSASPLGKVIIGQGLGEILEVKAPAGKLSYQIKRVER